MLTLNVASGSPVIIDIPSGQVGTMEAESPVEAERPETRAKTELPVG